MYAYIEGRLAEKNPAHVVIDVNGMGFMLHISLNTYSKIGHEEKCRLYTHLVIREDAQLLYGFADEAERELFRQLISVSGVGANTARLILSALAPAEVAEAILTGNTPVLQSVKGIGGKTAQRIVVDLKDKLEKAGTEVEKLDFKHNTLKIEALSGLTTLGFNKNLAEKALDKVLNKHEGTLSVEDLIKHALKIL